MTEPELPASDATPPRIAGPQSIWTARRVELEAELWGLGHLAPGGAAEMMRYALPLGLTSAATMLMLGAGAGGPPLCLAVGLGVWVSAFEADPVLLAMSRALIAREPNTLAKRATLAPWNAEDTKLPPAGFHHALMHEQVRACVPAQLLAVVSDALRPRGQLVLVETVAGPNHDAADPELRAWCRLDGRAGPPADAEAIELALTRLGFEIRVQEDMTARHVKLAMLGWKAMLRELAGNRPERIRAGAVVLEAELWMRRIRLLSDGKLRLIRWHAMRTR